MIDRISDKDNTLEHDGYRYRKILNDFEFELALSSQSLGLLWMRSSPQARLWTYNELAGLINWSDHTFRTAKRLKKTWTPYICIGRAEEAESNSSEP